jgi:aminoglycoside phosphotransferase (APT) family kinase protein
MSTTWHDPVAGELASRLAAAGFHVRALTPFDGDQRHRSWRAETRDGPALWAKAERSASVVAGVRREAAMLRFLCGTDLVPQLIMHGTLASGVPYLVTREAAGTPLPAGSQPAILAAIAVALQRFGALARLCTAAAHPGQDLFGVQPDLAALLSPALTWLRGQDIITAAEQVQFEQRGYPFEPAVLVHGSFHPANVIATPHGAVTLIDLEATRIGPASFDVASMAGGLIADGAAGTAQNWVAHAMAAMNLPARNIVAYLALRTWHRSQADVLTPTEQSALAALIRELS